ncbi:MAG: DNA polymerase I [Bacteroidia bacterium]|nr:DNA polymerase I [Bacteroidia bacterium]
MSEKKLFLLDGMALIYRAFFAFSQNPRITSYGLNVSAMFGFTNTLLEILQKQKPSHIAVVFDTSAPTERHEIYTEYKSNRQEMPEDLALSIPYVFRIIEAFRIPVITLDGYEADDIIGTLAKKAELEGYTTFMMTPDKDFGQLVSENIFIHKPARMGNDTETLGIPEILKKWEIERVDQVIDILGLWGDAVDNIPGVPGVGEKTAKKLIQEFGSIENIIANRDSLKGSLKDKFINFADQALLSKKLATIKIDCPVDLDEVGLLLEEPDLEKITELFKELEFKNLMQRVVGTPPSQIVVPKQSSQGDLFSQPSKEAANPAQYEKIEEVLEEVIFNNIENTAHEYFLVESFEDRQALIAKLLEQKEFCFDTETTSLDSLGAEILGIAFSFESSKGYYVAFSEGKAHEMLEEFRPVFEGPALKIAQNLKYDLQLLQNYGLEAKGPFFDTMLAHYLLEPDKRHNMDVLSQHYLKYDPVSITTLIGKKGKDQLSMSSVPLEIIKEYAAEDADITFQLKQKLNPILSDQNASDLFLNIEVPLVPVLADMERLGIRVDSDFLRNYSTELAKEIAETETVIYELTGQKFNIASPKQLGEILFEKLQLDPKAKKTKTGQYQTGEDILMKLASKSPVAQKIVDFRQLQKLKSTYVDALPAIVNAKTGRVHTTFNQAVAATGRLSSTNPNLQNIPVKTDKGREVRKAFIAKDADHVILSADYSQIELRIIASISEDEGMMSAFANNLDIHTATAAKVFGVPLEDVDKDMRRKAKSVNFGIIYGQGAFGLAENLGITRGEAKTIIENYFREFPRIRDYMDNTIEFARKNQYVQTLLGRRRYIRDINSANGTIRSFAERNAINAPIQGSAADMIKVAMINIHKFLKESDFKTKMILQVHDELLFDVPVSEVEFMKERIPALMCAAMTLKVPVIAEAGTGNNWLEAH